MTDEQELDLTGMSNIALATRKRLIQQKLYQVLEQALIVAKALSDARERSSKLEKERDTYYRERSQLQEKLNAVLLIEGERGSL